MKAFIFKPSNEFIGKFTVENAEQVPEEFRKFVERNRFVPIHCYIEIADRRWTVMSIDPLRLQEGTEFVTPRRDLHLEDTKCESKTPPKMSTLTRCAIWSGVLTVGVPALWAALAEGIGGNFGLGLAWFGVLPMLFFVPLGVIVTLALSIAAMVAANKRADAATSAQESTRNPDR